MSLNELKKLRELAANFYYKRITGAIDDWINTGLNPGDIDKDVIDLSNLLRLVYELGQKSKE